MSIQTRAAPRPRGVSRRSLLAGAAAAAVAAVPALPALSPNPRDPVTRGLTAEEWGYILMVRQLGPRDRRELLGAARAMAQPGQGEATPCRA